MCHECQFYNHIVTHQLKNKHKIFSHPSVNERQKVKEVCTSVTPSATRKKEKIAENQGALCPGRRRFALALLERCLKALEHRGAGDVRPGLGMPESASTSHPGGSGEG